MLCTGENGEEYIFIRIVGDVGIELKILQFVHLNRQRIDFRTYLTIVFRNMYSEGVRSSGVQRLLCNRDANYCVTLCDSCYKSVIIHSNELTTGLDCVRYIRCCIAGYIGTEGCRLRVAYEESHIACIYRTRDLFHFNGEEGLSRCIESRLFDVSTNRCYTNCIGSNNIITDRDIISTLRNLIMDLRVLRNSSLRIEITTAVNLHLNRLVRSDRSRPLNQLGIHADLAGSRIIADGDILLGVGLELDIVILTGGCDRSALLIEEIITDTPSPVTDIHFEYQRIIACRLYVFKDFRTVLQQYTLCPIGFATHECGRTEEIVIHFAFFFERYQHRVSIVIDGCRYIANIRLDIFDVNRLHIHVVMEEDRCTLLGTICKPVVLFACRNLLTRPLRTVTAHYTCIYVCPFISFVTRREELHFCGLKGLVCIFDTVALNSTGDIIDSDRKRLSDCYFIRADQHYLRSTQMAGTNHFIVHLDRYISGSTTVPGESDRHIRYLCTVRQFCQRGCKGDLACRTCIGAHLLITLVTCMIYIISFNSN